MSYMTSMTSYFPYNSHAHVTTLVYPCLFHDAEISAVRFLRCMVAEQYITHQLWLNDILQ